MTMAYLQETASQTAGPYVHIGLIPGQAGFDAFAKEFGPVLVTAETLGERIRVEGRVYDGMGQPIRDALVEIWQANAAGRYNSPNDTQNKPIDPAFRGWGRAGTDYETGLFAFDTIKPGAVGGAAPHISVWIVSRGINIGLQTRLYFADEVALNAEDPVLRMVDPVRRPTLLAHRQPGTATYVFDIRFQGDAETVFFDA
jgi:protocatechuate 3,4-dioxygenase alpha subunit